MKKIYSTILSIAIATTAVNAQTCILGENFTGYTGSSTALPAGWIGMNLSLAATGNAYTSAASCGPSGLNSFKFGTPATAGTKATLISPSFTVNGYDTVSFWLKGNSLDSASALDVYIGADTASMIFVDSYSLADGINATTGKFFSFLTYSTDKVVKFVYTKSLGNIGLDDFCIKSSTVTAVDAKRVENIAVRYNNNKLVVNANATVTLHNIIGQPVMTQKMNANETIDLSSLNAGIYIVNAVNGTNRTTKKIVVE